MNLHILASGSSGNCVAIEYGGRHIFIDVGVSFTKIRRYLGSAPEKGVALFVTHEHTDHILGLMPFVNACEPKIYSSEKTADALVAAGVAEECIYVLEADTMYDLGGFSVKPFHLAHDAAEPYGYKFEVDGRKIAVATDFGAASDYIYKSLDGVDTLVLESNYEHELLKKSKYPPVLKKRIASGIGHLSNQDAMQLAGALSVGGLKRCFLAHISENSNDYDLLERYASMYFQCYGVETTVLRQRQQRSFSI